jgi:hypothetical protein
MPAGRIGRGHKRGFTCCFQETQSAPQECLRRHRRASEQLAAEAIGAVREEAGVKGSEEAHKWLRNKVEGCARHLSQPRAPPLSSLPIRTGRI